MVKPKVYKCGKCAGNITKTQSSVQCEKCKNWIHANCVGLTDIDLEVLKGLDNKFYCEDCKTLVENRVRRSMNFSDSSHTKPTNSSNDDILDSIKGLREEIRDLRYDLKFYAEQYEIQKETNTKFNSEILLLKKENEEIRKELNKIKGQCETKENENRLKNVIVMGVKSTVEEAKNKPKDVMQKVEKILKYIGAEMDLENVKIKLLNPNKENTPISVTFKTVEDKHILLKKRKEKGKISGRDCHLSETTPIFINEDLSREARELFRSARTLLRSSGYQYVWAKDGRIFAKKTEQDRLVRLRSLEDVENAQLGNV